MKIRLIFIIFGPTDLRKGESGAKFDAESDFEVCFAVAPQKPCQICEKLIFDPKISSKKKWRRKMECRELPETRFGKV